MKLIKSNRGTSIVEVLVVMVVLLVGIMTVVRLFPPGFKSVKHAESMTFANRLAQYEIERWKNNSANLPDGILPIGSIISGGPITILNDQFPGPPIEDKYNDGGDLISDNAGTFRRVIGETTRIPFGAWSDNPTNGSFYVLAFGPIDNSTNTLAVRGGNLTRRILDANETGGVEPWRRLGSFQYGIDYGQQGELPQFCFPIAPTNRVYYINFSWWEQTTGGEQVMRTTTGLQVNVPANTAGWMSLQSILADNNQTMPTGFIGIDPYSDTVSRGFIQIAAASTFSIDDPYQYKLIEPTLGIISFNPNGYAQKEFGHALEAKIDYDILDPQIIREDKRVPTTAPYRVNLTLNHIKETDVTTNDNGDPYKGIHPPIFPEGIDVLAIDLETSMAIPINKTWINYKDGIITLPDSITLTSTAGGMTISPAGRNIRFFYKAEGDWSLQFHKAYSLYERKDFGTALDYKSYTVDNDNHAKLWFAACNANNSMSVDYDYLDENDQVKKVVGECHRATDALAPYGTTQIDSTWFELAHTPIRIYSVTGVSARARVIWREGERWRYVNLDTILTRKTDD